MSRCIKLKGSAMSRDRAKETRRRAYEWIEDSIRQGFGKPTQQQIRDRFALSAASSALILRDYNKGILIPKG